MCFLADLLSAFSLPIFLTLENSWSVNVFAVISAILCSSRPFSRQLLSEHILLSLRPTFHVEC